MRPRLPPLRDVHRLEQLATALLATVVCACGSSSASPGSGDAAGSAAGDSAAGTDSALATDAETTADGTLGEDALATPDSAGPANDASSAPASDADAGAPGEAGTTMSVYVTFYGWADNSPPGGAIAYPKSGGYPTLHETAGGSGTYADPITFATDKAEFPVGTRLYVPFIEKYVIMEDDCVECDSDWTSSHKWHIDLWMNSNGTETASSLTSCEDQWTRSSAPVEVDPPDGRMVTTTPLFTPATNTCRMTP